MNTVMSLFVSSLISFSNILQFPMLKFFFSLVSFIPKQFIPFNAIVNGYASQFPFHVVPSQCLLILYPQDYVPVVLTKVILSLVRHLAISGDNFDFLQLAGGREQMDMLLASNGQRQGILLNILQREVSHNKELSG